MKANKLWALMNTDVGKLLKKPEELDEEVRAVVEKAESEAQRRGVSVEQVIREEAELGTEAEAGLEALTKLMKPLSEEAVDAIGLDAASGDRLLGRLRFLEALDDAQFREATQLEPSGIWPFALAHAKADALADSLRAQDSCPPHSPDGDDFFEHLLEQEHLKYKDFRAAGKQATESGTPLLTILRESWLSEDFHTLIGEFAGLRVERRKLDTEEVPYDELFNHEWVRLFDVVPISIESDSAVLAAPYAVPPRLQDLLEQQLNRKVRVRTAPLENLSDRAAAYQRQWHIAADPTTYDVHEARSASLARLITGRRAVDVVDQLIREAINNRATDIHLEPGGDQARVRYRIDGICHEVVKLPMTLYGEVMGRLKVLCNMDVTERRRPQDGHLNYRYRERERDLRVATVPARYGEKVGLRIADAGQVSIQLEAIGLTNELLDVLRDEISRPYGMILATGPVGSGKTTTLYSCLNEFDRTRSHVMTIEDPVEIELPGVNQIQVNPAVGLTMTSGLRAILRQDPDKVLVGEIRDEETAKIAVRGSMTGLMVFSTLHANDSTGAITTLRNFNIPSFLIASSLRAVMAQRLLRRICDSCKAPASTEGIEPHVLGLDDWPEGFEPARGRGCEACFGTGYAGRTGVFELFTVDPQSRDLVFDEASTRAVRSHALERGMKTLRDDAIDKISQGITTIEEFHRMLRF